MSKLGDRIRAQRESWLELDDPEGGRALRVRRIPETQMVLLRQTGSATLDVCCDSVVGWRGFTEATFAGASVGSTDPLPFDADALREFVADDAAVLGKLSAYVIALVSEHLQKKQALEKN